MPFDAVSYKLARNREPRAQLVATGGSFATAAYTGTVPSPVSQLFTRYWHKGGQVPASQLQAVFAGVVGQVSAPRGERAISNTFALRGAWEPDGADVPAWNKATWGMNDNPNMPIGAGPIYSDPLGYQLAASQGIWFRSSLTIPNLSEVPYTRAFAWTGKDSAARADGSTDLVWAAGATIRTGGTVIGSTLGCAPLAIIGMPTRRYPSIAIIGTSIERGLNDAGNGVGALSWAERGCTTPAGSLPEHPFTNLAVGGGRLEFNTARYGVARNSMMRFASHVLIGFPINDCIAARSLAAIQADYKYLFNLARASGVSHITVSLSFPYTDGTNTTPNAITAGGAIVEQVETWLSAFCPDGSGNKQVDAVVDPAPVGQVRATANRRLWDAAVFGAGDGLHPETASHAIAGTEWGKLTATFTI